MALRLPLICVTHAIVNNSTRNSVVGIDIQCALAAACVRARGGTAKKRRNRRNPTSSNLIERGLVLAGRCSWRARWLHDGAPRRRRPGGDSVFSISSARNSLRIERRRGRARWNVASATENLRMWNVYVWMATSCGQLRGGVLLEGVAWLGEGARVGAAVCCTGRRERRAAVWGRADTLAEPGGGTQVQRWAAVRDGSAGSAVA